MNLLGMLAGNWVIESFGIEKYHWFMAPDAKMDTLSVIGKFKYFWTSRKAYKAQGKWHILNSPKNFLHVLYFMVFVLLTDMSNFFNKYNLNIPASHWVLGVRIWIVGMFAILAAADYYKYIVERKGDTLGVNCFMAFCTLIVEILLYVKHLNPADYQKSLPYEVKFLWCVFFGLMILITGWLTLENGSDWWHAPKGQPNAAKKAILAESSGNKSYHGKALRRNSAILEKRKISWQ
jgi:hypothetical protein